MKAQMFRFSGWIKNTEPTKLKEDFEKILIECGFGVCGYVDKHFEPFGFTCVFILSESHFAIHTFPEECKSYIELSSCIEIPFLEFKRRLKVYKHGKKTSN